MITTVVETNNGFVEYCMIGEGKPIVFIHGGHSNCNESIYYKGLDQNQFRFLTPSRPGYGNTPLTNINKTPQGTADLFIALLDELKIEKAIIVGISAGGLTALEMASNYPDRVEKLILMSALTKKWFTEKDKTYLKSKRLFDPKVEKITWSLYRIFFKLFPNFMSKTMFKELSKYRPIEYEKDEIDELRKMTLNMRSGKGFSNDLDQTIDQDILSQIRCFTLIIHSINDNAVPISHAKNANDKIRNSKLITFRNRWGHLLWLGKEYEQILLQLVSEI